MKTNLPNPFFYIPTLVLALILSPCEGAKTTAEKGSLLVKLTLPSLDDQGSKIKTIASDLSLELKGYRFDKSVKFVDSKFSWPAIPSGNYHFKLVGPKQEEVYNGRIFVLPKEEIVVTIVIEGPEHGPLPRKYHAFHMTSGGNHPGLTKTHHHGWIDGKFASGRREIFFDGFVFWRKDSGETGFRFDADYDLVADEDDPDDDNDGTPDHRDWDDDGDGISDSKDHRDPDRDEDGILNGNETRDLMLGLLQYPIIEEVKITNLFSPASLKNTEIGDVLEVKAKIHTAGGAPIENVSLSIFQNGQRCRILPLIDDGSLHDLEEQVPGTQISGDRKAEDYEFTRLIPLGLEELGYIFPSVLIIEASNKLKMGSNRWSIYLSNLLMPPEISKIPVAQRLESFSLEVIRHETRPLRTISYDFKTPKGSAVKTLQGSRVSPVIPQRNALSFSQYFDTVTLPSGELFLLTVVDPHNRIFYAGNHF